jgi:hypothetical protein
MNKIDCAALDATIRAIVQARTDFRPNEIASALAGAVVGGASEAVVFLARETIRERAAALEALDALRRIEAP